MKDEDYFRAWLLNSNSKNNSKERKKERKKEERGRIEPGSIKNVGYKALLYPLRYDSFCK